MPGGLPDAGGWILLIGRAARHARIAPCRLGCSTPRRSPPTTEQSLVGGGTDRRAGDRVDGRRLHGSSSRGGCRGRRGATLAPAGVLTGADLDVAALELLDQHGRRRSLAQFGQGPALLTFAFGHCTTVCPTIVRDLQRVRVSARRSDVSLIVLTLDPWRDTPSRLAALADQWGLPSTDLVLSGSVAEVERALDALGVTRRRAPATGDVAHVGMVMLLNGGRVRGRVDGGWGEAARLLATLPPVRP